MKRALLLIVLLVLLYSAHSMTGYFSLAAAPTSHVERVIDGDTVVLESDERVRLLGIDTPERGQHLYEEAKEWLANLIEGKDVVLERGEEERDKYDRLLRYVHYSGVLVNRQLVELGYAKLYMTGPEDPHYTELSEAEGRARESGLGVWKHSEEKFCIGIHSFNYNAWGNDNQNLNGEYVAFRNKCTHPVDITGWTVKDAANSFYTFPQTVVLNKTVVTLFTGPGTDTLDSLYWNRSIAVWNNDGDTLTMFDNEGNLMLKYTY